jgi:hypothetical protein
MNQQPSTAVRLDLAIEQLLDGAPATRASASAGLDAAGRGLVATAERLRAGLGTPAVAPRFEARLGARLAASIQPGDAVAWARRHPGRLIVTGAVGSVVGVGVTAFAVWRSGRRFAGPSHRLLHR